MESSKRLSPGHGALLGVLITLPWMALSYLGNQVSELPFPPYVLFDWVARTLPGDLVTLGIDSIVAVVDTLNLGQISETAKTVERILALIIFLLIMATIAVWFVYRSAKNGRPSHWIAARWTLILSGLLLLVNAQLGFGPAGFLPTALWYLILFLSWSTVLIWLLRLAPQAMDDDSDAAISRREFIYLLGGGVLTISVGSMAITRFLDVGGAPLPPGTSDEIPDLPDLSTTSGPAASPSSEALRNRFVPAPGTRPEITSNDDFYNVDINTQSPRIDGSSWRLKIEGLVDTPSKFALEEIRALPAVSQVITLSCISNPVGGDLISTAVWTGVPFKSLLDEVGLQDQAMKILIESEDGFYESISLEDAMDPRTLLVYEMNGDTLPVEHGYPLRIYIPDRYGMKQPKWITRMEVIDRKGTGYWVDRGWSEEAFVVTTSVIDAAESNPTQDGQVPIGGIAFAGARGISRVEVQIDDGPWQGAQLRTPSLSPLTWVQWRTDWDAEPGRHTIRVRAYDGDGQLQVQDRSGARPDGATGIHEMTLNI